MCNNGPRILIIFFYVVGVKSAIHHPTIIVLTFFFKTLIYMRSWLFSSVKVSLFVNASRGKRSICSSRNVVLIYIQKFYFVEYKSKLDSKSCKLIFFPEMREQKVKLLLKKKASLAYIFPVLKKKEKFLKFRRQHWNGKKDRSGERETDSVETKAKNGEIWSNSSNNRYSSKKRNYWFKLFDKKKTIFFTKFC